MDAIKFVEDLQKITKERVMLKETYEKCCNDPGLSLQEKTLMLTNYEVAYDSLGYVRDRILKCYMKE